MKIYTIVLDMQKLQQHIPPQIDHQKPVLFEDAHGRIAPFHVEFINSFEVRPKKLINVILCDTKLLSRHSKL